MLSMVTSRNIADRAGAAQVDAAPPVGWWALGISRIIIGFLWLQQTQWKLPPNFGAPAGLLAWMTREAQHPWIPLYGSFVKNVAIPNFYLFGWLTWVIETAVAVSLIVGLFSRFGALLSAVWALNLTVGLWAVPGEWYWTYVMLFMLNALFAATAAGRYIGLDGLIRRRVLPSLTGARAGVVDLAT